MLLNRPGNQRCDIMSSPRSGPRVALAFAFGNPSESYFPPIHRFVNLERQLLEVDSVLVKKLSIKVLGGREDELSSRSGRQCTGHRQRKRKILEHVHVGLVEEENIEVRQANWPSTGGGSPL